MISWKDAFVFPSTPLRKVVESLDRTKLRIVLVIDHEQKLLGVATDGDLRRAQLKNISMDAPIEQIMKRNPVVAGPETSTADRLALLHKEKLLQLPIITQAGIVIGLELTDEIKFPKFTKDNWVVIMAGGHGKRLRPYTQFTPKPMLTVGTKPVLETILENLANNGFRKVFISTFYLANQIQDHFGDGKEMGLEIKYLNEAKELGTAGCLGLLPQRPKDTLLLINGDVLTNLNFDNLLEFHSNRGTPITVCVRKYDFQVPYGVVQLDDFSILGIEEKPVHSFFVSSGIYALQPEVLDLIPKNEVLDVPELLGKALKQKKGISAFPLREYWVDIGKVEDLFKAHQEFGDVFPNKKGKIE